MTSPFMPGSGTCHRCGQPGHWQDDPACPWLAKARTKAEHEWRIDNLRDRYIAFEILDYQKREFIRHENKLWYDGHVPSRIGG